MKRLTLVSAVTCALAAAACLISVATAGAAAIRPPWLPTTWWAIGMCETGLDWKHRTRDYQGAFGFHSTAWDLYRLEGFPEDAHLATPRQQYRVALRIRDRHGLGGWGACAKGPNHRFWLERAP